MPLSLQSPAAARCAPSAAGVWVGSACARAASGSPLRRCAGATASPTPTSASCGWPPASRRRASRLPGRGRVRMVGCRRSCGRVGTEGGGKGEEGLRVQRAGSTPRCSAVPGCCVSSAAWSVGTVPCDTPTAGPSLPADQPAPLPFLYLVATRDDATSWAGQGVYRCFNFTALISRFSGPQPQEMEPFLGQGAWLLLCVPLPRGSGHS